MSSRAARPLWVIVGILLLPPIVVPLLVGIYDKEDPTLWGFPFYSWFQFLLIPVAALLTTCAYLVTKGDERPADNEHDSAEAFR